MLRDLRADPEDRVEHCLEALYDPEQCVCSNRTDLGEREEAELEAERRRWAGPAPAS